MPYSKWVPVTSQKDLPHTRRIGRWMGDDGLFSEDVDLSGIFHRSEYRLVVAYQYRIEESDMHPDLNRLAIKMKEWPEGAHYVVIDRKKDEVYVDCGTQYGTSWNEPQWLQARQQLGLEHPEPTEAEEEAWQAKERELNGKPRKAECFLQQAAELLEERGKQYDQPDGERSMGKAVAALNAITGRELTEAEGWLLMSLVKRVRQYSGQGYHKDSAEDGVTYGALEAEALESGK